MTLASQPMWWAVAAVHVGLARPPSVGQVWLAAGVALGAGVIATVLFFQATGMVRNDPTALAAAEAMQAAEILFATADRRAVAGRAVAAGTRAGGAVLVVVGIVVFSLVAARAAAGDHRATQELRSDRGA